MGSNSETQGYNFYPMLLFCRKFSNSIIPAQELAILTVSHNVTTAGNRVTLSSHAELMSQDARSAVAHTGWSTIGSWLGTARLIPKQTLLDQKQDRVNHALTPSSISTAKANTWLMTTCVPSGNITSTTNNTQKKLKKPMKSGPTQLT